jgi:hypothetical protein
LDNKNAFNRENFETFLVSSLFPKNEVDLNSVNINLNFFNGDKKLDDKS